tara:strand:+ start:219 stop:839 length:621 start_codon:yes stop_codon:yes gene_type:complete
MAYATRTGTKRNRRALMAAGWGFFLTPAAKWLGDWAGPYAIDNGAWSAHTQGVEWQPEPFEALVSNHAAGADFIVAPDIVAGGAQSLARSVEWLPKLLAVTQRVLIPVQDGMTCADVAPYLSPRVGLFVGGSTDWKLRNLRSLCEFARIHGAWAHVGRVNSVKRIGACLSAGATSFDGTAASRYVKELPRLDAARRQVTMFRGLDV